MLPNDILCRASIYPSCFRKGSYDRELAVSLINKDKTRKEFNMGHALSFASKFLCGDDQGVHEYGIRTEVSGNERKQAMSDAPLTIEQSSHYIGFFDVLFSDLSKIEDEFHYIRIYWLPENGSDEHFQFDMIYIGDPELSKSLIKQALRTTRQKIMKILTNPTPRPRDEDVSHQVQIFRDNLIAEMMKP
ncbi:hypothetical protein LQT97_09660 [Brucella pseudogrignonensis]|uniref:hypothetical protein n=1 Tax=Brucella pseudogrignonensis TaxID=419475 RepID=UPI001E3A8800|nr:hypothetical protein [Brucella pseudogrignonensis]MCD4511503.1 hypothetical protein [Brucella pseudogrignonensis]